MNKSLRVLFVSPEASPFAKSGDLADSAGYLSGSLARLGIEMSLVLPKYRRPEIEALNPDLILPELLVPLGADKVKASVFKAAGAAGPLFFIDNPKYFCRDEIYGSSKEEYLDNDERFTFFCRAVLEFALKAKLPADIIHCHDWPTALVPLFLRTHYAQKSHFKDAATVFSLHETAHQGKFPPESLALTGLNWDFFTPDQLALNGKFNFLKAGLIFSDAVNAIDPAFMSELRSGSAAIGFEEIFRRRRDAFSVIRNGADEATWERTAKEYLKLYENAIDIKRGGHSG
jgi:starch synthase